LRVKIVTKIAQFNITVSKNLTVKMKTVFCLLLVHHLFTLLTRTCKMFTIHFNALCQNGDATAERHMHGK